MVGTLAGWRVGSKWLSWAKGSEGPSTEKMIIFCSKWLIRPFVVAGRVQPTLDPVEKPSIGPMRFPRREEGNWLVCASVCVTCREVR